MKKKYLFETLEGKLKNIYNEIKHFEMNEGKRCECGGRMNEGECMECGKMYEMIDEYELSPDHSAEEKMEYWCSTGDPRCEKNSEGGETTESLHGNQYKLDRNNRIDSEDFKLLRRRKSEVEEEMEEGNMFTGNLAKSRKGDKFTMNGKTYTDTSDYDMRESVEYHIRDNKGDLIKLNENELVNLIENIVLEQESKGFKISKPKGLTTYEKAHKDSGRENDDYLKSVSKKMSDYLKTGSKGKYDTNPKIFPKGNGEIEKMQKKAFKLTDDLEDFNYEIAGPNVVTPDAINFNDEWMDKLYTGDSKTGNKPGGNALESEANERFNKLRKKNTLKKLKDQSYKRAPQPIFNEKVGSEKGKGLNIKLESMSDKEKNKINEEFDRMKSLFSYNRKTQ